MLYRIKYDFGLWLIVTGIRLMPKSRLTMQLAKALAEAMEEEETRINKEIKKHIW